MHNPALAIIFEAESALCCCKETREFLSMWLDLIPCDDEHESELCRLGILFSQVHETITHLEKAVSVTGE